MRFRVVILPITPGRKTPRLAAMEELGFDVAWIYDRIASSGISLDGSAGGRLT